MFVFSDIVAMLWEFTFLRFGNCMDFCFSQSMWETPDLGMFYLLILFPYYPKSRSPCFVENTTDVKTNKKFLFAIPFSLKRLCETLQ